MQYRSSSASASQASLAPDSRITRSLHPSPPRARPLDAMPDLRLAAAIDRHVATTAGSLADIFLTTLLLFDEPAPRDLRVARRYLEDLIETLVGVATGAIIGRITSTVIRAFGDDIGFALERQLNEAIVRLGPGTVPVSPQRLPTSSALRAPVRFLHDLATRPLVGLLATRFHPRLGRTAHDHHAALTRIARAVPLARVPSLVAVLDLLSYDTLLTGLWADHLRLAWQFYAVAISSHPYDEPVLAAALAQSAAAETWRAWLLRVRGDAPTQAPPRHAHG